MPHTADSYFIPSVTQITCQHINPKFFTPGAAERGTRVHQACYNRLDKIWDEFTAENESEYILSFDAWEKSASPVTILREQRFYSTDVDTQKKPVFCGTPDLVANLKDGGYLIDFKTSKSKQRWWKLQLFGYVTLIEQNTTLDLTKAASLRLRADKTGWFFDEYFVDELKDECRDDFYGLLAIYNFRHKKSCPSDKNYQNYIHKFEELQTAYRGDDTKLLARFINRKTNVDMIT